MDEIKHTVGCATSAAGMFGNIMFGSIKVANEWAGFFCGLFGAIAALLTIISWIRKWRDRRHRKHEDKRQRQLDLG